MGNGDDSIRLKRANHVLNHFIGRQDREETLNESRKRLQTKVP
jgi:hypothetical protein